MNLFELYVKIGAEDKASPAMKNVQKNSETLTNKIKVMSAQFESAQKNVDELTKKFNESVQKTGATSKETKELAKKLTDAEKEAEKAKKALDDYNSELEETEEKAENAGNSLSKFSNKLGNGLKTAAKIGAAAVGVAATGIVALAKQSVDSYAQYEQLVGGVETLFGAGGKSLEEYAQSIGKSADEARGQYDKLIQAQTNLFDYANEAYKTAGMSANDYMANATAFSASLISSLGGDTVKAAEYANRAMVSMSDNANKMGTSLDSIVQTYQSLSRGNMAMLDNLKLGRLHYCRV